MEIKKKKKRVVFGDECRTELLKGTTILNQAVGGTLGSKGKAVLIEKRFGSPQITFDGISIAKEIELSNKVQNQAVQALKQASNTTNTIGGDGSSTTIILAHEIFSQGCKAIGSGMDSIGIKKGIEIAVNKTIEELKKISKDVNGKEDIAKIATISANGDEAVGSKISELIGTIGHNSPISIEEGNEIGFNIEVVSGLSINKGYISPYFITNIEKSNAEFNDPYILLIDSKVSNPQDLIGIMGLVAGTGKGLLIIAEDITDKALETLIINKLRGGIQVCAVKAPGYAERMNEVLTDISVSTGATVISKKAGLNLKECTLEKLGSAKRITISQDETVFVKGNGSAVEIEKRCKLIRSQLEGASDFEAERLNNRLAKLSTGIGILKVCRATEIATKEEMFRVEDALNAARSAIAEGTVVGGGSALLHLSKKLKDLKVNSDAERVGVNIVVSALQKPSKQIAENCGISGDVAITEILKSDNINFGFNSNTGEYEDLVKAGVIDSTKVTRLALQNASSVASLLLITNTIITFEED